MIKKKTTSAKKATTKPVRKPKTTRPTVGSGNVEVASPSGRTFLVNEQEAHTLVRGFGWVRVSREEVEDAKTVEG